MCGRFTQLFSWRELHRLMSLTTMPDAQLLMRYNIAPTQLAAVVRAAAAGSAREGVPMRWGLIPSWSKDESIGAHTINARADTVASKPAFRSAFKRRRCIVPVSGFYEWKTAGESGRKQPHYIRARSAGALALAGLWESWAPQDGRDPIESFTIITTDANETMRPLHDRMPVILAPSDWDRWLDPSDDNPERLRTLLTPAPADTLELWPVSTLVNAPKNDVAECINRVDASPPSPPLGPHPPRQGELW